MHRDRILDKLNVRLPDAVAAAAIPAIALAFGLQCLRVLVPGLTWVLYDRFHFNTVAQAAVLLLALSATFLAGPLRRRFGYRLTAAVSLGSLLVCRLFIQLWPGDPVVMVAAAGLGVAAFVIFLPVYLDEIRHREAAAMPFFAGGLFLGLILDTLTIGVAGGYDLTWQPTLLPIMVTILLAGFAGLMLIQDLRRPQSSPESGLNSRSGAWLTIGPFIFLQITIFQNLPAQSALSGFTTGDTFLWLVTAQLAGLVTTFFFHTRRADTVFLVTVFSAGIMVTFAFFPFTSGWIEMVFIFLAQVSATHLLFAILLGMAASTRRGHTLSLTVAGGIGMLILGVLILGYSPAIRTALPFDNAIFIMLAALLVAGGAMTSLRYARPRLHIGLRPWLAGAVLGFIILALPLSQSINAGKPQTTDAGFPLRVLSLNLHNGFDAKGRLDLEDLAVEIERSGADVIALQEVSRGWLETGRADTLAWLSNRLGMEFYFGPTDGPLWGNAILSRYPIINAANFGLPSEGLQFRRGLIAAVIEVGGQNLQVIDLHLHHVDADSLVRVNQVLALIDFWDSAERTVIMGDFNAEPSSTEIGLMRGTGLIDVVSSIEPPPAYTYHSEFPYQRIDYIWVSADLSYSDVSLLTGTASDHFGVMATITE